MFRPTTGVFLWLFERSIIHSYCHKISNPVNVRIKSGMIILQLCQHLPAGDKSNGYNLLPNHNHSHSPDGTNFAFKGVH